MQGTFTLLACVLMSDQLTENSGNLWVWPGTHLAHAACFRDHGPQMFCAYPPIDLPELDYGPQGPAIATVAPSCVWLPTLAAVI